MADKQRPSRRKQPEQTKSLPRLRLTEWNPSEWYQGRASPTVRRLIHRHVAGKHTEHCITYDANYFGWYCKWVTDVFWPRPYFTAAIELSQQDTPRPLAKTKSSEIAIAKPHHHKEG